ncbi:hypothetical protein E2L08_09090 [Palleronia sediminis]|uniref:Uncharacterized protein n=1 Tax=Palleronia sediminis TaxID=2547833 RepID=A0A4R6AAV9_9RHOB|nr:hypothetical protein [Palleronia sediminis]TDL79458.1 hypothetical protein E2L08_09090 [Palleronia sediminis]
MDRQTIGEAERLYSDPDTRIALHLGFHCTGDEALIYSLRQNKPLLAEHGIVVPRRRFFVDEMRRMTTEILRGRPATIPEQEILFKTLIDRELVETLVLSFDSFLCAPRGILGEGRLYPKAGPKLAELRGAFPDNETALFCAIRNPATFLPEVWSRFAGREDPRLFLAGIEPRALRWSDVIARMRAACDDEITVWCHEDTPLIWARVMRAVAGLPEGVALDGTLNVGAQIMTEEGEALLEEYLRLNPPADEPERHRVLEAFFDKFAVEDEIEADVEMPGWSDALISELTLIYEDDLARIAEIPGVTLIEP